VLKNHSVATQEIISINQYIQSTNGSTGMHRITTFQLVTEHTTAVP